MKTKKISENEIKKILNEKKVLFGIRQAKKALKKKNVENIIVSQERDVVKTEKKLIFEGSSKKLGQLCGKPFNISAITILKKSD